MDKTSPLDRLTILGLGRKMDKIKKLANDTINKEMNLLSDEEHHFIEEVQEAQGYEQGYKQAMKDILDIADPHRHKLKDKKKVLDLLDFKEHLIKQNK
tara:strand:+ start:9886 stop:10179 length:294 start_codon:yes stop_codon:yes gene_type:complete